MNREEIDSTDDSIHLFLKGLGKYWKSNKGLNFSDIVKMLDSKHGLHRLDLDVETLTSIVDKLRLESCYTDLREEIAEVYSEELKDLDENTKRNLISTILNWHLSGEAYIKSIGMKIMVKGYLEGFYSIVNKEKEQKKDDS